MQLDRTNALTLQQAAAIVPALRGSNGCEPKPPHYKTLWNWSTRGVRGVVLETQLVGGSLMTTAASLQTFFARLSDRRQQAVADRLDDSRSGRRRTKTAHEARLKLAREHGI
jgi:hypothetical protein